MGMLRIRKDAPLVQYTCDMCEGTALAVENTHPAGWYFPIKDALTLTPEYTGEHFCSHCRKNIEETVYSYQMQSSS